MNYPLADTALLRLSRTRPNPDFINSNQTSATLSGLTAPNDKLFFQVEAVGAAAILDENRPELPKEMAEQGVVVENPNLNAVALGTIEQAALNGK